MKQGPMWSCVLLMKANLSLPSVMVSFSYQLDTIYGKDVSMRDCLD